MRWLRDRSAAVELPFDRAIDQIADQDDPDDPQGLADLVALLRPRRADDGQKALEALNALLSLLERDDARRQVLAGYLAGLLARRQHRYLYTDTGIVSAEGLRRGTLSRLSEKWLPQAPHRAYLRDLFKLVFSRVDDSRWVQAIPLDRWRELWVLLAPPATRSAPPDAGAGGETTCAAPGKARRGPGRSGHWLIEIGEAISILATRLYAAATNNEVVRLHHDLPYSIDRFDQLAAHARVFRDLLAQGAEPSELAGQHTALMSAISACEKDLAQWRGLLRQHGTTTSLSQQMLADGQMLQRLRSLALLSGPQSDEERIRRALRLYRRLIEDQGSDSSVRDLWSRTNRMLASQVTEHAGMIGEHYVAATRSAWFGMIRAASGAGAIVALLALNKLLLAMLALPPLWNALAYSLNYAAGFVVVHLLHLAIATKQPAMTAALIASTVQASPSGKRSLTKLAALIVAILRTQFVAIFCNVAIALPTGVALYYGVAWLLGPDWISAAKTQVLLTDIDPLRSLSLLHAAIAGVFLYLSGVLAGYYNNLCAVTQVPERLARAGWLRWIGVERRARVAAYVGLNLGNLVGNASLGVMLGMAAFVGFLTGLPIDVRHVTLSAANLGFALPASQWSSSASQIAWLLVGVMLIGLVNLTVSFTLALWTAFSANGVRLRDGSHLWTLLWRRVRRRPSSLLLP